MRNERNLQVGIYVLLIIIIILASLLIYENIKNKLVKDGFKDFMEFQGELTIFMIEEECGLNYNQTIDNFLKYKFDEILNNISSEEREE